LFIEGGLRRTGVGAQHSVAPAVRTETAASGPMGLNGIVISFAAIEA
jgi:hypothetical protein